MKKMNQMIKYQSKHISSLNSKLSEVENMKQTIRSQSEHISSLNSKLSEVENMKKTIRFQSKHILSLNSKLSEVSSTNQMYMQNVTHQLSMLNSSYKISAEFQGIFNYLKSMQKTKFDLLFVASQSSNDIYSLIDPNADSFFGTSNNGEFLIQFEIKDSVRANGIEIFSSGAYFPRSFDIFVDEKLVISIKEANELNGSYRNMKIFFRETRCKRIKILQTGPNWDKGSNYIQIKRVELLSPDQIYKNGVFSTLIAKSENQDPHKSQICITSTFFDLNCFHSIDAKHSICTYNEENSWFQVELIGTRAILRGFRLKRVQSNKLRSYKIICSDTAEKQMSEWTTLITIEEKNVNENDETVAYMFPYPSPLTRFIRIVQTGKNWNDNFYLQFYHLDFLGTIN